MLARVPLVGWASEYGLADEPSPGADAAAITDSRLDVDAAMRTLPPPQRAALVLVDMLGYSVADASAILGVSEGTVKSRINRGREELTRRLLRIRQPLPGASVVIAGRGNGLNAADVRRASGRQAPQDHTP